MFAAEKFDEGFYTTAAQVIPVLLLALIVEFRLGRRRDDEELGFSITMIGLILAMLVGEWTAFTALADQENQHPIADAAIWAALIWGIMLFAFHPIIPRWSAVHAAMPLSLVVLVQYGLFLSVVVLFLLAEFGVVSGSVILVFGAVVAFLVAVAGMLVSEFRKAEPPSGESQRKEEE